MHHVVLKAGLEAFVMHGHRDNFFAANREGLCSIAGYLAIYLIAVSIGNRAFAFSKAGRRHMILVLYVTRLRR